LRNDLFDRLGAFTKLALPKLKYVPAISLEFLRFSAIPRPIPPKFLYPECAVVFWQLELAMRAPMPETAMNENCDFATRKSDVRTAGNVFRMKTIAS
jgi:hypothetical protein